MTPGSTCRLMPAAAAAGRSWSTASSTSTSSGIGAAPRCLLGLDEAEVEQVVDDAGEPFRLPHDALGQRAGDRRVVFGGEGLRQHLERADRRLELVAHVGDEVAPHALDAVHFRHVDHERGNAQPVVVRADRNRRQMDHRARRAEDLQLALAALAGERTRHQRVERARRRQRRSGAPPGTARPPGCGTPRCHRRRATSTPRGSSSSTARNRSRCSTTVSVSSIAFANACSNAALALLASRWAHRAQPKRPVM